jgi:hypothetical protein
MPPEIIQVASNLSYYWDPNVDLVLENRHKHRLGCLGWLVIF